MPTSRTEAREPKNLPFSSKQDDTERSEKISKEILKNLLTNHKKVWYN